MVPTRVSITHLPCTRSVLNTLADCVSDVIILCLPISPLLELENDAVSSVYDMAGDDKERMVYDVDNIYVVGPIRTSNDDEG